ncbi:hypothetical protein FRB99_005235 [Tulasnella sp. 403]|nr:hypothetical protein FRB99_005235 [Tulasnella sp. 403]
MHGQTTGSVLIVTIVFTLFAFVRALPPPTPVTTTPTMVSTSAGFTPSFICLRHRAQTGAAILASTNGTAVTGLELTDTNNVATLSPNGFVGAWTFDNGGVGAWDYCTYKYLNIEDGPQSYKPLTWSFTQKTKHWVAAYGKELRAAASGNVTASSLFLACRKKTSTVKGPPEWDLYLQTGTDLPLSICAQTKLFITNSFST